MSGQHCIEAQICRADFYYMLSEALDKCGGCSDPKTIERYQNLRVSELINIVAQNGLRIIYMEDKHISKT